MQRTIWEWLGIERTTDKSRIKKAYAEQSKKYHPEEFPEQAQEIRKAYKEAIAQASVNRIVLPWAEDDDGQENPHAVREAGDILKEHFHPDSEPDAGSEQEYVYTGSVPPGSGSGSEQEYVYTGSVPPGSGSGSEQEYVYTGSVPPEAGSGSEQEYVYTGSVPPGSGSGSEQGYVHTGSVPPEAGSGSEQGYVYTGSVPPEAGSGEEPEYRFVSTELPPGMAMRIAGLKKRMEDIYSTDHRNFAEKWRQAFLEYPYPKDLRDIRAVWEIFTVIEPMTRLKGSTWEILQTELFRFREDTASWQLLQERFDAVRRPCEIPAKTPKKTSLTEFCAVFLIVVTLVGSVVWVTDKIQERRQHLKLLEYQKLISEQIQMENPTIPVSRGAMQTVYTKEFPYKIDLNQDGITDHIYYDPDEGLFMVELYNASTYMYKLYGSVDQYMEENPEMYSIKSLSHFIGGGY